MAISASHLSSSCKAVPGRCYNRNRQQFPAHAKSLPLLLMMLAAMPTSCLALTSESTTLPSVDIELATTLNPPQQPTNEADVQPKASIAATVTNETNVRLEPDETVAAEVADEFVHTSFVSLGGEGLEQGIRNAVKSEVESEIEADSSALVETLQVEHQEGEPNIAINNDEETDVPQGVREPKSLEVEEGEVKPEEIGEAELSNEQQAEISENAEKGEELEKDVEPKMVEEIPKSEDTETPDNSKGVEKAEEPAIVDKDVESIPAPDSSSAASEQVEESPNRPLPTVTSDLVAVIFDENRAITEQPITKTNQLDLEKEHDTVSVAETTQLPLIDLPKHQVTKKQGVEELLPIELPTQNANKHDEPQPEAQPTQEVDVSKEPGQVAAENAVESSSKSSVQVQLNEIESEEKELESQTEASITAQLDHVQPSEEDDRAIKEVEKTVGFGSEPVESEVEQTLTPAEADKEKSGLVAIEDTIVEKVEAEQSVAVKASEPSATVTPAQPEATKDDESDEDDSQDESDAEKGDSESQSELGAVEPADKDSSEESDEVSADETKAKAEDSTATPLVSYPPHNAGQTFDSNLADERSAHLSRTFTDRSTLIIALCSGTAVLFIVISLFIFVFSFQRQHGTLDIEMQEQRLGKDDLDLEDAQMKLLDVELSTPVIIAMGNEETDECL